MDVHKTQTEIADNLDFVTFVHYLGGLCGKKRVM